MKFFVTDHIDLFLNKPQIINDIYVLAIVNSWTKAKLCDLTQGWCGYHDATYRIEFVIVLNDSFLGIHKKQC